MFFQVIHQTKIQRHPYLPPSAGVPRGNNGYCYMWARKGAVAAQFLLPDLRNLVSLPMTITAKVWNYQDFAAVCSPRPAICHGHCWHCLGPGIRPHITGLMKSLGVVESTWHWIKWIHLTYKFERFEPKLYTSLYIYIDIQVLGCTMYSYVLKYFQTWYMSQRARVAFRSPFVDRSHPFLALPCCFGLIQGLERP